MGTLARRLILGWLALGPGGAAWADPPSTAQAPVKATAPSLLGQVPLRWPDEAAEDVDPDSVEVIGEKKDDEAGE